MRKGWLLWLVLFLCLPILAGCASLASASTLANLRLHLSRSGEQAAELVEANLRVAHGSKSGTARGDHLSRSIVMV